jgi:hypothetical protein
VGADLEDQRLADEVLLRLEDLPEGTAAAARPAGKPGGSSGLEECIGGDVAAFERTAIARSPDYLYRLNRIAADVEIAADPVSARRGVAQLATDKADRCLREAYGQALAAAASVSDVKSETRSVSYLDGRVHGARTTLTALDRDDPRSPRMHLDLVTVLAGRVLMQSTYLAPVRPVDDGIRDDAVLDMIRRACAGPAC